MKKVLLYILALPQVLVGLFAWLWVSVIMIPCLIGSALEGVHDPECNLDWWFGELGKILTGKFWHDNNC